MTTQIAGACAGMLQDHLSRLRGIHDHPNRVVHYDELLCAMLLGFFDNTVQSLRTLDARSLAGDTLKNRWTTCVWPEARSAMP